MKAKKHKLFAFGFGSVLTMFPRLPDELRAMEYDEQVRANWYSIQPLSDKQEEGAERTTMLYNVEIDKYGQSAITSKSR